MLRAVSVDVIPHIVYRFPTAVGASTLSPNAAASAARARQPVQ
jgi:hypothetical protein